jgi:hypothetical protein
VSAKIAVAIESERSFFKQSASLDCVFRAQWSPGNHSPIFHASPLFAENATACAVLRGG